MDRQERYVGYALAGFAAVVFTALWAPHIGQPHFGEVLTKAAKGVRAKTTKTSATAELAFGLVLAAMVGWSAVLKKRWLLAGVVFYLGLLGPGIGAAGAAAGLSPEYHYLGYPLMAAGAWLLFRNSKLQAEEQRRADAASARTAKKRSSPRGSPPRPSSAPARSAKSAPAPPGPSSIRSPGRSRKRKGAPSDPAERPVPPPSKRYTPPQGERKERRERRESVRGATRASTTTGSGARANPSVPPKV